MLGLLSVIVVLLVVMPALLYGLGYAVHHYGSGKKRAGARLAAAEMAPLAQPAHATER